MIDFVNAILRPKVASLIDAEPLDFVGAFADRQQRYKIIGYLLGAISKPVQPLCIAIRQHLGVNPFRFSGIPATAYLPPAKRSRWAGPRRSHVEYDCVVTKFEVADR